MWFINSPRHNGEGGLKVRHLIPFTQNLEHKIYLIKVTSTLAENKEKAIHGEMKDCGSPLFTHQAQNMVLGEGCICSSQKCIHACRNQAVIASKL